LVSREFPAPKEENSEIKKMAKTKEEITQEKTYQKSLPNKEAVFL